MNREELQKSWVSGQRGKAEDIEDLPIEDLVWVYQQIKQTNAGTPNQTQRANIVLLIRAIRDCVHDGAPLYYAQLFSGYPYQESSNYGINALNAEEIKVRVFGSPNEAQDYVNTINRRTNTACTSRGRAEHDIATVGMLGFKYGMNTLVELERFGTDTVTFGLASNPEYDLNLHLKSLQVSEPETINFFAIAPKVLSLIGLEEQAIDEVRSNDETGGFRTAASYIAAHSLIACAISKQSYDDGKFVPLIKVINGIEYIACFSDWVELKKAFPDQEVYLAAADWDKYAVLNKPISINEYILLNQANVHALRICTDKARLAISYIAACYGVDEDSADGGTRCVNILTDIIKAEPVLEEFYHCFSMETTTNADGRATAAYRFNLPDGDAYTIDDLTAKLLVDTKVCTNPAAAYHVLAQLCNDTNGSAHEAFQHAQLYD